MSIRHMSAVLEDPYYGQGDKSKLLVALILADCARTEDGKSWPSIETIARKSRTSIRGAQESVRELEKDGKIRVELNSGRGGTNCYFLLLTPATVAPPQPLHPRNGAPEIPPEKAALNCTQNHQEPSVSVKNGKESSAPAPSKSGYVVPACFENVQGFSAALANWIEHRNKLRKSPTGHAVQLFINKLAERPMLAISAIDMTIEKGWQSIEWEWFDKNKPQRKHSLNENLHLKIPIIEY